VRALLLALALAGLFGAAFWWQERHWAGIRAEQSAIADEQDARVASTPSGTLAAGQAVLIVGNPSGAEAVPRPAAPQPPPERPPSAAGGAAADPDRPVSDGPLPEFELVVQPGQTLSGLAHLHYGEHGRELLRALAQHNGLSDPDQLRAGAVLRLPPLETLLPERR
jgi:nucleoid-associated protein YgaU